MAYPIPGNARAAVYGFNVPELRVAYSDLVHFANPGAIPFSFPRSTKLQFVAVAPDVKLALKHRIHHAANQVQLELIEPDNIQILRNRIQALVQSVQAKQPIAIDPQARIVLVGFTNTTPAERLLLRRDHVGLETYVQDSRHVPPDTQLVLVCGRSGTPEVEKVQRGFKLSERISVRGCIDLAEAFREINLFRRGARDRPLVLTEALADPTDSISQAPPEPEPPPSVTSDTSVAGEIKSERENIAATPAEPASELAVEPVPPVVQVAEPEKPADSDASRILAKIRAVKLPPTDKVRRFIQEVLTVEMFGPSPAATCRTLYPLAEQHGLQTTSALLYNNLRTLCIEAKVWELLRTDRSREGRQKQAAQIRPQQVSVEYQKNAENTIRELRLLALLRQKKIDDLNAALTTHIERLAQAEAKIQALEANIARSDDERFRLQGEITRLTGQLRTRPEIVYQQTIKEFANQVQLAITQLQKALTEQDSEN